MEVDRGTEFLLYVFGICVLILGMFHLVSCFPHPIRERMKSCDFDYRIKEIEYNRHQYIKYDLRQTHIIMHSPDCPCWTNRLESLR